MKYTYLLIIMLIGIHTVNAQNQPEKSDNAVFVNSVGIEMTCIKPGVFQMGSGQGDHDELPIHRVNITDQFYMSVTEITNQQYEKFDPQHSTYRGVHGLSDNDNDAVIFVSWYEAKQYCEWLSKKEGKTYRLPTEAEWEYACRAGTTTAYSTGDQFPVAYHKNQKHVWQTPEPVSLAVGSTPPNAWGLYDMHGNVEEWCHDWYGAYVDDVQTNPVGRINGVFKVTRGGSHHTTPAYLRSANRLGTLPEDKHWLIGFRVVMADMPESKPIPEPDKPLWAKDATGRDYDWSKNSTSDQPLFVGPVRFVHFPENKESIPMYPHNHCPSITWCDNGDLLAVWFSTKTEAGREMTILASRFRAGKDVWDAPSEFFKAPDRNMTGSALYNDGKGTIYHLNGLESDGTWGKLAATHRISNDNGVTWSHPRLISPEHRHRNQIIHGLSQTKEGYFLQPCDAVHGGSGGTALLISKDKGATWNDPGLDKPEPKFEEGKTGAWIAGIHAGVVQLLNGDLMALGRSNNINDRMPMSISKDMGQSWKYSANPFPPISSGQRLVLTRLRGGQLFFASFTDSSDHLKNPEGIIIKNGKGEKQRVYGLFAALSYDDGKTWPVKRLITNPDINSLDGGAWTGAFTMDATHAEPKGYLAMTQTPDGVIHLISSALHYRFNLAWLE